MKNFITLIKKTGVDEEATNFGQRDIGGLFNLSIQTQVDEIYSQRHMEMSLLEFKEVLGRIADKTIQKVPEDHVAFVQK